MNNKIFKIFTGLATLIIIPIILVFALLAYVSHDLPNIASLADYHPAIASQIFSRDGTLLTEIGSERREIVQLEHVPQVIVDAFLSAEDDKFFQHKGVDYFGIMRAMLMNLKAGKVVQGGSTITQQVAKSLLLSSERSMSRKLKDFLLAQKIEAQLTKRDILFLYLNQVYLGGGMYGIKAAFNGYFGKTLREATIAESAMIAGLLVAPGRYSPYVNPAFAKRRQEYVLGRMLETKKITKVEYESALKEKIHFRIRERIVFNAGHFTDWMRQRLIEKFGEERLSREGLKIKTTLDYEAQKLAESEILFGVKDTDKRQGYKGPLRHIEDLDEKKLFDYEKEFRKNYLASKSEYFYIDETRNKIFELHFDEEKFKKSFALKKYDHYLRPGLNFWPGNNDEVSFVSHFHPGESHQAVVVKTDDINKLIYVDVGGATGVIPYELFNWARPREISEKIEYFPLPNQPSKVVKIGDVVLVAIKNISVELTDSAVQLSKKNKIPEGAKKQKYMLCELDQEPEVEGALVAINPKNGELLSMVGGHSFTKSQFNRAIQSKRQPGSSFKPFLFAAALENGFTPTTIIMDSPEALSGVSDDAAWKPKNYDNEFLGPVTFRESLEQSRNIPTIKIAHEVGVEKIINFCRRIGLNAKLENDLSLALGSFGVTLFDIVRTYSIFPNGGKTITPKTIISIVDRENRPVDFNEFDLISGSDADKPAEIAEAKLVKTDNNEDKKEEENVVVENPYLANLNKEQVYDPRLAYVMSNLLKGVIQGPKGTAASARDLGYNIAGKTGTTSNYVDAWFIGFSQNVTTGVWIGFDDNKTLGHGETGSKSALPVWKDYMRPMLSKYGDNDFARPAGIINVLIDRKTGELANNKKEAFMESFVEGMPLGPTFGGQTIASPDKNTQEGLSEDDYYNNQ